MDENYAQEQPSQEQISDYISNLEQESDFLKQKNQDLTSAVSSFSSQGLVDKNLVQWGLDTDEILDRIEHFLKGDVIKTDEEGNIRYVAPKNKEIVILNEYGVNSIMQIIQGYVNKNTMLSFYTEERIYEILSDFGYELTDFIFCNYEMMGMDTEFKKSRYKMIVLNILHIVESAYRRALFGKEREEANTGRIITQNDRGGGINLGTSPSPQRRSFSLMRPSTW